MQNREKERQKTTSTDSEGEFHQEEDQEEESLDDDMECDEDEHVAAEEVQSQEDEVGFMQRGVLKTGKLKGSQSKPITLFTPEFNDKDWHREESQHEESQASSSSTSLGVGTAAAPIGSRAAIVQQSEVCTSSSSLVPSASNSKIYTTQDAEIDADL